MVFGPETFSKLLSGSCLSENRQFYCSSLHQPPRRHSFPTGTQNGPETNSVELYEFYFPVHNTHARGFEPDLLSRGTPFTPLVVNRLYATLRVSTTQPDLNTSQWEGTGPVLNFDSSLLAIQALDNRNSSAYSRRPWTLFVRRDLLLQTGREIYHPHPDQVALWAWHVKGGT